MAHLVTELTLRALLGAAERHRERVDQVAGLAAVAVVHLEPDEVFDFNTNEMLCGSSNRGYVSSPMAGAKHYVPPCTKKPCPTDVTE
jgi:hypothetical protein